MFKVIALIAGGIFLMAFGVHFLMNANLAFPFFQLPSVNWGVAGFVALVASAAVFGSAFVVSRLSK
jgi:hypothetical protein